MAGDRARVRSLLDTALEAQQAASIAFDEEYPAEPPTPEPPPIIRVKCGENVQAALDQARHEGAVLLLEMKDGDAGIHKMNLVIRNDPNALPVVMTSDTEDVPAEHERVRREDEQRFARLKSANGSDPAIRYECGASGVHLVCLAILPQQKDRTLIAFGTDSMTAVSEQPHDIVHDRILLRGDPAQGQCRGIQAHALRYTLRNSCAYDFWQSDRDAQALAAWNGGQYLTIRNCELEAGAENVMFGGGDARVPELAPQHIVIEDCLFTKNANWVGTDKDSKCLLELKHAQHVAIRRNVFQHQWAAAWANGEAIVIKCANQHNREPWTLTSDVLIEHNVIRKIGQPFSIVGKNDDGMTTELMRGLTIRHNLCYDIDTSSWQGKGAVSTISNLPDDLVFDHNTIIGNLWGVIEYWYSQSVKGTGFTFSNNVVYHGKYGIKGPSGMDYTNWQTDMGYAPTVSGNALRRHPERSCKWGTGNKIIPEADFDASLNPDYSVKPGSAIASVVTTDGQPIGADLTLLPTAPGRRR